MVDIKVAYSVAKIMTRFYLEWVKHSSEIT
jgi:hypothetical protein